MRSPTGGISWWSPWVEGSFPGLCCCLYFSAVFLFLWAAAFKMGASPITKVEKWRGSQSSQL